MVVFLCLTHLTSVCNINYHIVWSAKYRRKILTAEIESYLKELANEIGKNKDFVVRLFECGEMDHIHCFISAPPKLSVTIIVKYLNGITGRKLFEKYPDLREKLWKDNFGIIHIIAKLLVVYQKKTLRDISKNNLKRIKEVNICY